MECVDCQKKVVLFKCSDGEYRCIDCMKKTGEAKSMEESVQHGEYEVKARLRDQKTGDEWVEHSEHMTLTDFEEYYGTISAEILWLTIRKFGHALI